MINDDDFSRNVNNAIDAGWFLKKIERLSSIGEPELWRVTIDRKGMVSTADGHSIGAAIRVAMKLH